MATPGCKTSPKGNDLNPGLQSRIKELKKNKEKQKEIEGRAMEAVESLLDNPISLEFLQKCCQVLAPGHYNDVTVERSLDNLCGYPICSRTLPKKLTQKYHISTTENKVYDISDRKNFCCNGCFKVSRHLEQQITVLQIWMKSEGKRNMEFVILPPGGQTGLAGDVVVDRPGAAVKAGLLADLTTNTNDNENDNDDISEMNNKRKVTFGSAIEENESVLVAGDQDLNHQDLKTQDKVLPPNDNTNNDEEDVLPEAVRCDGRSSTTTDGTKSKKSKFKRKNKISKSPQPDLHSAEVNSALHRDSSMNSGLPTDSSIAGLPTDSSIAHRELSKVMSPRYRVEKCLREWKTDRTTECLGGLVVGNSSLTHTGEMSDETAAKCERIVSGFVKEEGESSIAKDERTDSSFVKEEGESSQNVKVPELSNFDIKVRNYFTVPTPKSKSQASKSAEEEEKSDWMPILPPIDSQSQIFIRRKIVLDALRRNLTLIIEILDIEMSDIYSDLRSLVQTFNLSKDNILLKSHEWCLMSIFLLVLVSNINPSLASVIEEKSVELHDLVRSHLTPDEDISSLVFGLGFI